MSNNHQCNRNWVLDENNLATCRICGRQKQYPTPIQIDETITAMVRSGKYRAMDEKAIKIQKRVYDEIEYRIRHCIYDGEPSWRVGRMRRGI